MAWTGFIMIIYSVILQPSISIFLYASKSEIYMITYTCIIILDMFDW